MTRLDSSVGVLRWVGDKAVALSRFGTMLGGWLYLFTALYITSDVLTRRYLNFTTKATDEVSTYVIAGAAAWSMAYALKKKDHVRMDVVLLKLPLPVQGYLNVLSLIVLNGVVAILVWRMWSVVLESFRFHSRAATIYQTPLAWPQLIWAMGFTIFLILGVVMLLEALLDVSRGRVRQVAERFGPRSVEADVAL